MAHYGDIQKEETLKAQVFLDFFGKAKYSYEPDTDNIDFIVTAAKLQKNSIFKNHYLWAEAKKGVDDIPSMLTQLILTIKKTYDKGEQLPPPYIGCFDTKKFAFVPFHDILPIFKESDFNWNITPSNHDSADFQKAKKKISKLILKNIEVYDFTDDKNELISFIANNLILGALTTKNQITKNNFVHIYNKWVKEVKPFINMTEDEWQEFKKAGILDCDFYRADMMSSEGSTITEKLKIVLDSDNYKLQKKIEGRLFSTKIDFSDDGTAYRHFWNKYERPPALEYHQFIIDRRDLLVPQNIREVKGSFFTPAVWVEKSQEYLEAAFGKYWQDEYVVWDCAAGTGNLLAGLVNKYNLWASTLDQPDVDTMHARIDDGFNLLPDHVFQFDFLNNSFDKLPKGLKDIIDDPEKQKKLIIYINPPYAEHGTRATMSGKGENKSKVATEHNVYSFFKQYADVGTATRELFAQFFLRVYRDIANAKLASFGTLKYTNSQNFSKFRDYFKAKYLGGFICQANTFDNVNGQFPTSFLIWDLSCKAKIENIKSDILVSCDNMSKSRKVGTKTFYPVKKNHIMVDWLRTYFDKANERIGYLRVNGPDFANNQGVFLTTTPSPNDIKQHFLMDITKFNITEMSIYFAVRHCIKHTWINHNDQFLYPKVEYENDVDFVNNCLVFALFHGKNNIQSHGEINNWLPFSEQEVNAKTKFKSNFMYVFLSKKNLSSEAKLLLDSGKILWRYYHDKISGNRTATVDASFYEIRGYFQGINEGDGLELLC